MSDNNASETRRARLAARRKRYRWAGILVAAAIIGAAGTVAAFAVTQEQSDPPDTGTPSNATTSTIRSGIESTERLELDAGPPEDFTFRPLSHEEPLTLWVGGDSLAGALGPALGELLADTGIVDTEVDYKVSSGLASQVRNWQRHGADAMSEQDPEVVVFMIGTNDATIVNSQDSDRDGVPDWEDVYRASVAKMMDTYLGSGAQKRTVYWIGAPPMRTSSRDKGVVELNRVMREEAEKRAPYAIYVDAYSLFADEDGHYTDTIELDNGDTIRVRIGDGVHFTPKGAEYLARHVFSLLDARFKINEQADPEHRISYTVRSGGETSGSGSNGSGSGNRPHSTTTVARDDEGDGSEGPAPTTTPSTAPATTVPNSTPTSHGNSEPSPSSTTPGTNPEQSSG